ncbi:branched-chain amino acid ABC transporter permease [Sulfitobacter sp. W002]|uniref:branched-chain amino acid ABC transporter permease n=1 Tax=Sulfitobacter sp. W002 TaxID=2867024 RepID=UPI0021A7DD87|nr:branched-chain amino acid ABC transporter permease [Sulfitobacter sp. W002]
MEAFAAILFWTRLGREMRATSTNIELSAASGIDTRKVINTTVFLSGVLAALGGMTLAMRGSVSIDLGTQLLLPVFAVAILGGLGNALGPIAGALVISAAETVVTNTNFGPFVGQDFLFMPANYAQTVSFAILILFLLFRPSGLFTSGVSRV